MGPAVSAPKATEKPSTPMSDNKLLIDFMFSSAPSQASARRQSLHERWLRVELRSVGVAFSQQHLQHLAREVIYVALHRFACWRLVRPSWVLAC